MEPDLHGKTVKDIGLDPIPDNYGSDSAWPLEFKRLQREIIELWHACNVSLVHRTYFFLLFKGDPKDYIYMEVEHRRLSFLKNVFSHGNQAEENGRALTPASRYIIFMLIEPQVQGLSSFWYIGDTLLFQTT